MVSIKVGENSPLSWGNLPFAGYLKQALTGLELSGAALVRDSWILCWRQSTQSAGEAPNYSQSRDPSFHSKQYICGKERSHAWIVLDSLCMKSRRTLTYTLHHICNSTTYVKCKSYLLVLTYSAWRLVND